MTQQYVYEFNPRGDITAFEVACLLRELIPIVKPKQFDDAPAIVRRHFDRIPAPPKPNVVTQNDSS